MVICNIISNNYFSNIGINRCNNLWGKARFLKSAGYIFHKGYGNNCPYDLSSRFVNENTRDIIFVYDINNLSLKNIRIRVNNK